jgi:glycerol-3-phosphate dehydrogenase
MTRREVAFLAEKEKVVHLGDLILRRSLMAYLGHLTRPLVDELVNILADVLDWDNAEMQNEIESTLEILKDKHGVVL